MSDTITITLNGKQLSVLPGGTILEVATEHGTRIPNLAFSGLRLTAESGEISGITLPIVYKPSASRG